MLARDEKNFAEPDRIIDALRSATNEMYASGIPDIILEMALMKLTASAQNFIAMPAQPSTNEKLDEWKKIFYDVASSLNEDDSSVAATTDGAVVTGFANNTLTVNFNNKFFGDRFKNNHQSDFEKAISKITKRKIKISVVIDENLSVPVSRDMSEVARANLNGAMKVFNASGVTKIND